ncbi:hypothetical protein [Microbulbifer mangrovi]|uniref:hypothetical protein n=1 Tax=Microbulbifer mangrovi TaxID=927787 RepID=UPI00099097C2|nr:hypothetical protein [Microbulbifer mangrovi]
MINNTVDVFLKRAKVYRDFSKVARLRFVFDVLISFVKILLELLVMILPIKIVLILAAPEMPVMFDKLIPGVPRAQWAAILTALIVVLHAVVLTVNWYLKSSADIFAQKFSAIHKKGKFSDSGFLRLVYSGIVDARSGSLVLIALSAIVGLVYFQFLIFFWSAFFVAVSVVLVWASVSKGLRDSFIAAPSSILGGVSSLLFLSCFCFLVYEFTLSGEPPDFLQGIVSIILARRLLGAVTQKVGNLVWFNDKKTAIQKLFYRGHVGLPQGAVRSRALIDSVSPESLSAFCSGALESIGVTFPVGTQCKWVETPIPWMSIIQCEMDVASNEVLVLKVYEPARARVAKDELELYPLLESAGIIPTFLGVTIHDGYQVHAFRLSNEWSFVRDKEIAAGLHQKLLPLKFERTLVEEYCSVHPTLADRVTVDLLSRLFLAAIENDHEVINAFMQRRSEILSRIRKLPLTLVAADQVIRQFSIVDGSEARLLSLGDWKLEPLGFAIWPSDSLDEVICELTTSESFTEFADNDSVCYAIELCSQIAELERCCRNGRLREGIQLMRKIMEADLVSGGASETAFVTA